jgi:hypothetical protein
MIAGKQVNCYLLSVIGSKLCGKYLQLRHVSRLAKFLKLGKSVYLRQTNLEFADGNAQKKDGHPDQDQGLLNDVRKA